MSTDKYKHWEVFCKIYLIPSGSCLQDKASSRSLAVDGSMVKMHSFLSKERRRKGKFIFQLWRRYQNTETIRDIQRTTMFSEDSVETSSKLIWKSKCNLNKKRGFSQVNLLGFSLIFLFGPTLALNSFPLITDFPPQKVNNLAHQVHSKETSRKKAWCLAARVKIDCS